MKGYYSFGIWKYMLRYKQIQVGKNTIVTIFLTKYINSIHFTIGQQHSV